MPVSFAYRQRPDGVIEFDLLGRWTVEAADAFVESKAESLVLNYALGFEADDLSFLRGLPVRHLTILDYKTYDVTPIYSLKDTLTSLSFGRQPTPIDLAELPSLVELTCDWANVADSIAKADGLRRIVLGRYQPRDISPFSHLGSLETLRLSDRPRVKSLLGLKAHTGLKTLFVAGAPLSDLLPLAGLTSLTDLGVPGCARLDNLDALSALVALRALDVSECGAIRSLRPLRGMGALECLEAHGSTKIVDGDLTPLLELPRLREVRMMDRRAYKPRLTDVQNELVGRRTDLK